MHWQPLQHPASGVRSPPRHLQPRPAAPPSRRPPAAAQELAAGPPAGFTLTESKGDTLMSLAKEHKGERVVVDVMVNDQASGKKNHGLYGLRGRPCLQRRSRERMRRSVVLLLPPLSCCVSSS